MSFYETYSQRQKRLENENQDTLYEYDTLPVEFRIQLINILNRYVGRWIEYTPFEENVFPNNFWECIYNTLTDALGKPYLSFKASNIYDQCMVFLQEAKTNEVLDFIELAFRLIVHPDAEEFSKVFGRSIKDGKVAVEKLNSRFKLHGLGYRFENEILIRIDSGYLYTEATVPVFALLREPGFEGANEEFVRAHEHFRHGRYKDAITDASNALESTLKIILTFKNWPFNQTDPMSKLVQAVNGSPNDLVSSSLNEVLSGLGRLRNAHGGHGQGANVVVVPEHYASYALHLAASNIIFLVEAYKASNL